MSTSRPFSIFLLKDGFDATNALREDHTLDEANNAANLPNGSKLFVLDSDPKRPWWRGYFGIQEELWQSTKGALLFLPVGERYFALSFGFVFHHLNDYAYEYDFGLIVTLNSLDPKELKSADMIEPGAARRKRTQVPVSTELTYLDFDGNSEIIKSLTGKVKAEYKELFRNATGSASLKVSLKLEADGLAGICETLLELYQLEDYKEAFPNIQNIAPVRDPAKIDQLNGLAVEALREEAQSITLTIPDIVDYRDNTCCIFRGRGNSSDVFPDITLEEFYEFFKEHAKLNEITVEALREYSMMLTDIEGTAGRSYNIFRCLVFEVKDEEKGVIYHLNEGDWYKVEQTYADRLQAYLDEKCEDADVCAYNHDAEKDGKAVYSEENYNKAVPEWNDAYICLDQKDISPQGNTQIEPCDLFRVGGDETSASGYRAHFYHVKISTRSAQLSHLFNQGVNSVQLIQLEPTSLQKIKELVSADIGSNNEQHYLAPLDAYDFKVIFGIITHKDSEAKSNNLPLFSKISLMRNMQQLDLMKVQSSLMFIADDSPKKDGHKKYNTVLAEVCANDDGKNIACLVTDNGVDETKIIKRCPKAITESAVGTRFNVSVREKENGEMSSYHAWPYSQVAA